jgi:hypothetical protein
MVWQTDQAVERALQHLRENSLCSEGAIESGWPIVVLARMAANGVSKAQRIAFIYTYVRIGVMG